MICLWRSAFAAARKALGEYSAVMIEQFLSISAARAILAYSLHAAAPETVALHRPSFLIITAPFVIYRIFRYLYLLHGARSAPTRRRSCSRIGACS